MTKRTLKAEEIYIILSPDLLKGNSYRMRMDTIYDSEHNKLVDLARSNFSEAISEMISRQKGIYLAEEVHQIDLALGDDLLIVGYEEDDIFISVEPQDMPALCEQSCKTQVKLKWTVRFPEELKYRLERAHLDRVDGFRKTVTLDKEEEPGEKTPVEANVPIPPQQHDRPETKDTIPQHQ